VGNTVVPLAPYPVVMPQVSEEVRGEFRFLEHGGAQPWDKTWRQWSDYGRWWRRRGTRESPLAFAYVYLTGAMKPMRTPTGEVLSFSEVHVAWCEEAKTWMKPDGRRIGLIASRGLGKSFWTFLALPLWAIAHGHRNFFAGYSDSDKQAVQRLDDIRRELQHNELLQFDFPELAIPKGARNNSHLVNVASGRSFASNGLDVATLGLRPGKYRPDLFAIDDGEKNASNYAKTGSKGDKASRLATIRDVILPMNAEAVVVVSGTVVMHDSIGHDLVRAALGEPTADWITQERFTAMYTPPILDEGTPWERSVWPEWRSLESLKEQRQNNPDIYALHMANQPTMSDGRYWKREDFRRNPHFPLEHFVMYVDPAEGVDERHDKTALVAVGTDVGRHRAVVMHAEQGHFNDQELGRRIAQFRNSHPEIPLLEVYVEGFNSGRLRLQTLQPLMPHGVRIQLDRPLPDVSPTGARGKLARIERAYAHYCSKRVWHPYAFPELEARMCAFPRVNHDDDIDALAGALRCAKLGAA
jgi:terminase large subunit-like protein